MAQPSWPSVRRRELPPDLPVVDLTGYRVTPGLIDAHVHSEDWHAPLYLANGVTAVRDVGCALATALNRRKRWNAAGAAAPRLVCCGPLLDSPGKTWRAMGSIVSTPEEAGRDGGSLGRRGRRSDQALRQPQPRLLRSGGGAGHRHGKRVIAHLQDCFDARQAIEAGIDGIEHLSGFAEALWPERRAAGEGWRRLWAEPERERVKRLVDLVVTHGTWLPITRVVWQRLNAAWTPTTRITRRTVTSRGLWSCGGPTTTAVKWPQPSGSTGAAPWPGMQIFTAALIEAGAA